MLAILARVCGTVTACCLALMMVLTVIDAVGRYFFSAPLDGAVEYISFLLAFMIFSAYPLVTREEGHISVGILIDHLPGWYQKAETVFSAVALVGLTAGLTYLTIRQAISFTRSNMIGQSVPVPMGLLAYCLAGFAALAVLFALSMLYHKLAPHIRPRVENT